MSRQRKIGLVCMAVGAALIAVGLARAGEPVGGSSSIICDSQGHCTEHATVVCPNTAFPWGLSCWNHREGRPFVRWLNQHGTTARTFKQRHPQLAARFDQPWPPAPVRELQIPWPWNALADCESGDGDGQPPYTADWDYNGPSGFDGGLQFLPSTWNTAKRLVPGASRYPYAWQAPAHVQVQVARAWLAVTSWSQWPACSAKLGLA